MYKQNYIINNILNNSINNSINIVLSRQGIQLCDIRYPKEQKNPKCSVSVNVTALCLFKSSKKPRKLLHPNPIRGIMDKLQKLEEPKNSTSLVK